METNVIIRVTDDKQLNIPPEMQSQLQPGDEYKVVIKDNTIVLEKIPKVAVDLDAFLEEMENLKPEADGPSLEEISEVVKEVRQELWSKKRKFVNLMPKNL